MLPHKACRHHQRRHHQLVVATNSHRSRQVAAAWPGQPGGFYAHGPAAHCLFSCRLALQQKTRAQLSGGGGFPSEQGRPAMCPFFRFCCRSLFIGVTGGTPTPTALRVFCTTVPFRANSNECALWQLCCRLHAWKGHCRGEKHSPGLHTHPYCTCNTVLYYCAMLTRTQLWAEEQWTQAYPRHPLPQSWYSC